MNKLILIFIAIILFFSCYKEKERKLDVRLSQDVVVSIMKDITRAEHMLVIASKDSTDLQKRRMDYMVTICKHYNTTVETYKHDLKIYLQDDQLMKQIFEKTRQ